MKQIILIFTLVVLTMGITAQIPVDSVLATIELNNTTLAAIRKNTDAEKIGNKTGIYLSNPEVEFNYLWGNPSSIGNRTDFSIRQSFDFPTAYSYRNQIANIKNDQAEIEYLKQSKEILFQARLVCVDLMYYNKLISEISKRQASAKQLADAYKAKFDIGETGILEYNKAQIYYLTISKELERIEIERTASLSELAKLNGGIAITFNESNIQPQSVAIGFEQWYATAEQNSPVLQWLKQEINMSEKQKQLAATQNLPKFNAGYMSEKVVGQQFQGVSVGVSIPLLENKNAVKYAKANKLAIQSIEADAKLQYYNQMKMLHTKAIAMQNSIADYRKRLAAFSNTELLQKALDKGEISLSEYFFELSVYYESIDKLFEAEKSLNVTYTELHRYN
ncbi:MAG TPA: transporter [Prolixibacteraceae bacterium]|nr:transporter [Prolixibacteraceae bacterium]